MPALARFDARSTAQTWLYAIARRVAADHVRQAQRRLRTSPLDHLDGAEDHVLASRLDEAVALRDLLRALDADRREAFVLTQMLGLSYDEAAHVCDCPDGTAPTGTPAPGVTEPADSRRRGGLLKLTPPEG